jgi:hypothetical protein
VYNYIVSTQSTISSKITHSREGLATHAVNRKENHCSLSKYGKGGGDLLDEQNRVRRKMFIARANAATAS